MTDRSIATDLELEALDELLAVYGPDVKRWPLASQQRFVALLANNTDAQGLLTQAVALERLISETPPPVSPDRLAAVRDNVLAAAKRERDSADATTKRPHAQPSSEYLALRPPHQRPIGESPAGSKAGPRLFGGWSSAALAASLILGLAVGGLGLADQGIEPEAVLASAPADNGAGDEGSWAFAANASDEEDSL